MTRQVIANQSHTDSAQMLSATLWKAIDVFGERAVQAVVESEEFVLAFPDLHTRLRSDDVRTKYDTQLPAQVLLRIAGRDDCAYDFLEDPKGNRITAVLVGGEPSKIQGLREWGINLDEWTKLDRQEALRAYGAHSLWRAVDRGVGYIGEHDYYCDW